MTNDEKAKAYEMALEAARKELGVDRKEWEVVQRVLHNIFPELRESEDERIRKAIVNLFEVASEAYLIEAAGFKKEQFLSYLEKQKEQKPKHFELKAGKWYICHRAFCCRADHLTVKEGERFMCEKDGVVKGFIIKEPEKYFKECSAPAPMEDEEKEQKPASTKDMYIADEHFYEQEPVDSFKYRLAEYMTKNCTGHSYNISSESILQMAKEELIKRGELKEQKTADGLHQLPEKDYRGSIYRP